MTNFVTNLAQEIIENFGTIEVTAPKPTNSGDATPAQQGSGPTNTPTTATGNIANTSIDISNNDLAHSCDFATTLQKNNALKRFLRATAEQIRNGIRALLRYLGLGDGTGTVSWIIGKLKWLAAEIKYIQKKIVQPILDFQKVVIAYTQKVSAMIAWIKSLPAQILALLKNCLSQLVNLLSSVFSDILETDTGSSSELIAAAQSVANSTASLVQSTVQAVAGTAALPAAVISTVLSSPSQTTLNQANTTIATFNSTYVSPAPSINHSAP